MQAFNESLSYDKRMYGADIQGSQAYIVGLTKAGVLTEDERKVRLANLLRYCPVCVGVDGKCDFVDQTIHEGLDKVREEWDSNAFVIQESDEDIHTANERRLAELIGPVAGMLLSCPSHLSTPIHGFGTSCVIRYHDRQATYWKV